MDAAIDRTGAAGQHNRLFPARMMVYYAMALAMFSAGSSEEFMRSLLAGMEWITGRFREWTMPTKALIFKVRKRLSSAVMIELFATCATPEAKGSDFGVLPEMLLGEHRRNGP